jgi:hypothetical protein
MAPCISSHKKQHEESYNLTTWTPEPKYLVSYLGAVRGNLLESPFWQNSHVNTEVIHG